MTGSSFFSRRIRKIGVTGLTLARGERGAAIVEMALVLPLLLALLMGVLVYGQYFMLAHNVQQAANDGARASIVGLDAADRSAVANRAVGIFITPRSVFDISRYSLPAWLYTIMSIGRLRFPSSAIVVPVNLAPGVSAATGNFTSGVQR